MINNDAMHYIYPLEWPNPTVLVFGWWNQGIQGTSNNISILKLIFGFPDVHRKKHAAANCRLPQKTRKPMKALESNVRRFNKHPSARYCAFRVPTAVRVEVATGEDRPISSYNVFEARYMGRGTWYLITDAWYAPRQQTTTWTTSRVPNQIISHQLCWFRVCRKCQNTCGFISW